MAATIQEEINPKSIENQKIATQKNEAEKRGAATNRLPFNWNLKTNPKRMKTKVTKNPNTPNNNLENLILNLESMKNDKNWHQAIGVGSASFSEGVETAIEAIKEFKNHINVILWDTDKIGVNCLYHYVTDKMQEDEPALKKLVEFDEFVDYVRESELNVFCVGPNDYEMMSAWDYAIEYWEDVKTLYWDNHLKFQLESEVNHV